MKFIKALGSFVKAHPVGSAVAFLFVIPLLAGGVAVSIYRTAKSALPASIGDKLPVK